MDFIVCLSVCLPACLLARLYVCVCDPCACLCVCVCVNVYVYISRPSDEAASPEAGQSSVPERTSGTFPGSISVVYRDKVMTAL